MSARRPPGATWTARHWPAIRARGMRRFVLVRGLLIGMAALMCAVGGMAWGAVTWFLNERLFHTLQSPEDTK